MVATAASNTAVTVEATMEVGIAAGATSATAVVIFGSPEQPSLQQQTQQ